MKALHLSEAYYGFIYHYYRAEVYRETNWRNRLDITTNWSIVVTAAMLSYVFTNINTTHTIILINYVIVWFFLYIESRRYRYYSILKERTRILEKELLAAIFDKGEISEANLAKVRQELVTSLEKPQVSIPKLTSIALRLRRSYLLLIPLLFFAWLAKLQYYQPVASGWQFLEKAQVWIVPGWLVFTIFLVSVIIPVFLAFYLPNTYTDDDLP